MGYLDELRQLKNESSTALTANPDLSREAWRCQSCNALMYLKDKKGPTAGAPAPKWGGPEHQKVCTLCFQMKSVLDSNPYWLNINKEWREKNKKGNKLRPGEDYFAS